MNNYSFPYPVLGDDQSISGDFSFRLSLDRTGGKGLKVVVTDLNIENDEIRKLVEDNKASVMLRFHCASTFYSSIHHIQNGMEIKFCDDVFVNKCEAEAYITLNQNLDYSLNSFHEDYKGYNFSLRANDIIGKTGVLNWTVPRNYEKISNRSLFKFVMREKSDELNDEILSFNFLDEYITVLYPFNDSVDPLKVMFEKNKYVSYWSIIIPALTEAITIMQLGETERSEYEDFLWYSKLESVIDDLDLDLLESAFVLAQKVYLSDSFNLMFKEMY